MSQAARDLSARFAHLLQPIKDLTKNWEIDVAAQLEEYLEEVCAPFLFCAQQPYWFLLYISSHFNPLFLNGGWLKPKAHILAKSHFNCFLAA